MDETQAVTSLMEMFRDARVKPTREACAAALSSCSACTFDGLLDLPPPAPLRRVAGFVHYTGSQRSFVRVTNFVCAAYQMLERQLGSSRELKPKLPKPALPMPVVTSAPRTKPTRNDKASKQARDGNSALEPVLQKKHSLSTSSSASPSSAKRKAKKQRVDRLTQIPPVHHLNQHASVTPAWSAGNTDNSTALGKQERPIILADKKREHSEEEQAPVQGQKCLLMSQLKSKAAKRIEPQAEAKIFPLDTAAARKVRWEQHEPTSMVKVTQRLAREGPVPFKWISLPAHLQPSPAVARTYPWLQRAWETMTRDDVKQMTEFVWNGGRLDKSPVYLGWLQCPDHPARKHGQHVHNLSHLELGVFASRDIEKGEVVLNYVGAPISWEDPNGGSLYSQGFSPGNDTLKIELDAQVRTHDLDEHAEQRYETSADNPVVSIRTVSSRLCCGPL